MTNSIPATKNFSLKLALIACLIVSLIVLPARAADSPKQDKLTFVYSALAFRPNGEPIGVIESFGGATINGRAVQGREPIWGGELIQAKGLSGARITLNGIGQATLAPGTSAHLATGLADLTGNSANRVLTALLLTGELRVKLQSGAGAYLEAGGSAFTASAGASFRLAMRDGQAVVAATIGVVSEEPLTQSKYRITEVNSPGTRPISPPSPPFLAKNETRVPPNGNVGLVVKVEQRKPPRGNKRSEQGGPSVSDSLGDEQNPADDWEPAPGVIVRFELIPPTLGTFDPPEAVTDQQGIARTTFRAGSAAGTSKLKITETATGESIEVDWDLIVERKKFWTTKNKLLVSSVATAAVTGLVIGKLNSKPIAPLPPPIVIP